MTRMTLAEYRLQIKKRVVPVENIDFQIIAKSKGYEVTPEFQFIPQRKFRADWRVSKNGKCCLVEYEGIKSKKSRHTTITGYTKDCEKYNLAQLHGYVVFRYTILNFNDVWQDLEKFFL